MAQIKRFSWTNPETAVVKNLNTGFSVAKAEIWDLTKPNRFEWTPDMGNASVFVLGTLAYTNTNGVSALAQDASFGAKISGFTEANPGVITVNDTETFGFQEGDTIKVSEIVDDASSAKGLNGKFTVASVTATTITLVENTSSYSKYVAGGIVTRVSDKNGHAVPIENKAIRGISLGTNAVGDASSSMVAICYGEESVV